MSDQNPPTQGSYDPFVPQSVQPQQPAQSHPAHAQPAVTQTPAYPTYPPYPPAPPAPPYPPAGMPQAYAPAPAPQGSAFAQPAHRRSGLWWVVGIVAIVAVIGSCAWLSLLGSTASLGSSGKLIAVIPINGVIAGTGSATGGVITPQGFRDQLKRAVKDDNVKAIVLRVDSPGGTVAASEEISLYVKQCKKPVVVSVGDVDASGAYMVSSQADKIFALPGSAVGSIGVITEIPNVSGLLTKLGIKFTVITAGKYKDAGSPYRALTPTETALIQGQINEVYGQFIDIVAEGRSLKRSEVEKLATGWAWNGTEAKKLGLIDGIGTYSDALDEAAKLGGIEGGYDTVSYDTSSINDLVGGLLGLERQLGKLAESDPRSLGSADPVMAK